MSEQARQLERSQQRSATGAPRVKLMTPHELARETQIAIIDVRPKEERNGELGFVPGSRSFSDCDLDGLARKLTQDYGPAHAIAVACLSGKRSLPVAEHLRDAGLADVAHLEGGILSWHAEGLPLCGVRSIPKEELVPLSCAEDFPRAVLSCFVAESVEAQLDAGAEQIANPRQLVERVFDGPHSSEPDHLLACLDLLAEQARRAGHPLGHIALNVDRMRASLMSVVY